MVVHADGDGTDPLTIAASVLTAGRAVDAERASIERAEAARCSGGCMA